MNRPGSRIRLHLSSAALLLAAGVVSAASCADQSSAPTECAEGRSLCGGECVDVQASAEHCGACGDRCAEGQRCAEGRCVGEDGGGGEGGGDPGGGEGGEGGGASCSEGQTACSGSCVDVAADPQHCGACGSACAEGEICDGGACTCAEGLTECGGACVDLASDRAHCGGCEASCSPAQQCVEGECSCAADLTDCGGTCANLKRSQLHCGSCGNACENGASCVEGACSCVLGDHEVLADTYPQALMGSTAGGPSNYTLECVSALSPEKVYLFTPSETATYTLDTFGSTFDTAIAVLSSTSCAPLGCNDDSRGPQSRVRATVAAGESVVVVVTGADGSEGEFKLNVSKDAAPRCPSGEATGELPLVLTGDTARLGDAIKPSCGQQGGPDMSYTFTAPAEGRYVFDTFGSDYDTVLEVRNAACDGSVIACNDDSYDGSRSRVAADLKAGQTVVVVVDGAEGEGGPFKLNISRWAPLPCPMLDLGSTYPQTVEGSTAGLDDRVDPTCGSSTNGAPEVTYSFTAPVAGRYTFDTIGSRFDTLLHVRDGSCAGPSLGCNDNRPDGVFAEDSRVVVPLAEGQTAYVIVDGAYGESGAFTLNVSGTAAPACPVNTLESATAVTVTGTTANLGDFLGAPCGRPGGAEATYGFVAPSDGVYVFDTIGSMFDTTVHVHDGTCSGRSLGCNDNATGTQSRVAVPLVAGQAVVVAVDGSGASASGTFTLNVSMSAGEATCANPIDLGSTVPQTVTGSTLFQPSSSTPGCTASSGNDRVYRFTAPADGTYVIDTQHSTFDTVLHVHDGASCSGTELACNDNASGLGAASSVSVPLTAGQVITIVADSRPSSSGNLTLRVAVASP